MAADLITLLWHATLASSIAIALVLLLRKSLRHRFGAQVAYVFWALVPVAIGVSLIPAPVATGVVAPLPPLAAKPLVSQSVALAQSAAPSIDIAFWMLCAWLAGVVSWALWLAYQQRRFLVELGRLDRYDDNAWRAQNVAACPALIGAWRPRIVLPLDFDERYSAIERTLILAHELTHVARADAALNLGVSVLRCVFWFNPLLHAAAARFRFDQELACDASVISRFPEARRPYADAMLKTQLADRPGMEPGLPVGCHWQSSHPLKERISMLKSSLPSPTRKRTGIALCAVFVASVAAMAWAEQPKRLATPTPGDGDIRTEFRVTIDGDNLDGWSFNGDGHERPVHGTAQDASFSFVMQSGKPFSFTLSKGSESWVIAATASTVGDNEVQLATDISHNGANYARPMVVSRNGEAAAIKIGEEKDNGAFIGFEAQVTMTRAVTTPGGGGSKVDKHAAYRSITRIPYPAAQAKAGIGGTVFVLAHIGVDGRVVSTGIKSSPGDTPDVSPLVTAALQGVQGWTFNPAQKDGKAVASDEIVPVVFKGSQPLNVLSMGGQLDPIEIESTNAVLAVGNYEEPSENVDYRKLHPPRYPLAALQAHQSGRITLKVLVSAAGEPESAEVYNAEPSEASQAFADSSIAAVMQWRFNPGMKDGEPVPGYVLIPFTYSVTDDEK